MRNFAWRVRVCPDPEIMKEALHLFSGTHNFSLFRGTNSDVSDSVRTIYYAGLRKEGDSIWVSFIGNGFLYKMVRMMTASVYQAGIGQTRLDQILERLDAGADAAAMSIHKLAAPPQGLFLEKVYYSNDELSMECRPETVEKL